MLQQKFIQIKISEDTKYGQFNDALYFTDAEYSSLKQSEIDKMARARVDAWIAVIENPVEPPGPTEEDLKEQQIIIDEQIASLQDQKQDVASKLDDLKDI